MKFSYGNSSQIPASKRIAARVYRADRDSVTAEAVSIGELQGRLRSVHLTAHLETRAFLTSDQVTTYQRLRGYGDSAEPSRQHRHPG
jgi:hypothetical protein